jgi:pimeloyl-ACP methyl ester carboxylesterase
MLDVGESQMSVLGGALPPWIDVQTRPGYILTLMPEPVFYGDVEPQVAATCAAQLRSQSVSSFVEPLTAAGWREHPSTYITCTEDQAIPPNMQEVWSARAGTVHALPSSHSPFLSRPDELAGLIADAVG